MSPTQIIAWIKLALLILAEGEKLVDLGIRIYHKIEESVRRKRVAGESIPTSAFKASAFDAELSARAAADLGVTVSPKKAESIREKIWATRIENRGAAPKNRA